MPLPLDLVEEIFALRAFAKEQPVLAGGAARRALFDEGPKRRDAGAGADHDERHVVVGRQAEGAVAVELQLDDGAGRQRGQIVGCRTWPGASFVVVVDYRHRQMHFIRACEPA